MKVEREQGPAVYFQREPLVVRLTRLAEAGRTGVLRVSGDDGGAIHLRDGAIVYAECRRTPDPGRWFAHLAGPVPDAFPTAPPGALPGPEPGPDPVAAPGTDTPGLDRDLAWAYAVREATLDAALELLSARPRYALRQRFRDSEPPVTHGMAGWPLAELLTEVERRRHLMRQMATSPVPLTADTPLVRVPDLAAPRMQVSALQWALLIRVDGTATPRTLAWEIGNSVFATTLEVFRLIALRFLTVAQPAASRNPPPPGAPARPEGEAVPGGGRPVVSFLRAVDP
ncbi:DUF4388 domain-containing protein [Thermopolyspora flexuosa]|jgi:hypothetical protein|uniref:Uncharacterized protein DUF4388 n=1 Tax=Thermopolyspora flexuosa TaxID=103836 RepID=A0A543J030_9ACTN|nr:DUF4388 domain-containing protein [Thermopolyspora flexuosa]TQM76178.1 uncharacterized protein DUF4388 [Thermopolyspora flexuosa]